MSTYEGIEPTRYEITWQSGHVETIPAHQVSWPGNVHAFMSPFGGGREPVRRVQFHVEINGQWTLQLSAVEDDIRTIRNLATEAIAPEQEA